MSLPVPFQFSQSRLQDYVECSRRFQLRHVLMQPWPASITQSPDRHEDLRRRGAGLHRLAHQHALGIESSLLEATIHDPVLAAWWQAFLAHPPADLPEAVRKTEIVLSAPLAGHRLVAKLDLVAAEPGERVVIVDWKTALKRPSRTTLARRLQTSVYRYVVAVAGQDLNEGQTPIPEQVEMVYWFANHQGEVERFPYSSEQFASDGDYLADLITQVASHFESIWPLTPDDRHCRICNYRSLCDRNVEPGFLEDLLGEEEEEELVIDLEQIAEIEF